MVHTHTNTPGHSQSEYIPPVSEVKIHNTIYSFSLGPSGKLNFNHTQVFQRMASELLPRVPELSSVDVTRCAKSLAFLKWLHMPQFEDFTEVSLRDQGITAIRQCPRVLASLTVGFGQSADAYQ